MQFLSNLISKIGLFLFFIILEVAAVFFMITKSDFHKNAIGVHIMAVNGYFSEKFNKVHHYVHLPEENARLVQENITLKNKLENYALRLNQNQKFATDSAFRQKFNYIPSQVIDYSLRKKDNYFLLNKGANDGVKPDMAVLSPNGVVGAVLNVSDHYASVISVLHSKTYIKARVKGLDYLGIIVWPGEDHRELSLTEIPKYLDVKVGDTIVTAGASASYPEGALIGSVSQLTPNNNTGDYDITVKTFDDLASVENVYVVENLDQEEIEQVKALEDVITE